MGILYRQQEALYLLGRGFPLLHHKEQCVRVGRKRQHVRRMEQRGKMKLPAGSYGVFGEGE